MATFFETRCISSSVDDVMFSYPDGANGPESSTTLRLEVCQEAYQLDTRTTTAFSQVHQNVVPGGGGSLLSLLS